MEQRKSRSIGNRNKHRYTPLISAFVVFIIFMGMWGRFIGVRSDIGLTSSHRATFFFTPLLLGWLIGWAIRFRFAERRYTKRGISVSLAQFLISVLQLMIPFLYFLLFIRIPSFTTEWTGSDGDFKWIASVMFIFLGLTVLSLSLYTQLALWLRQWFGLSHFD